MDAGGDTGLSLRMFWGWVLDRSDVPWCCPVGLYWEGCNLCLSLDDWLPSCAYRSLSWSFRKLLSICRLLRGTGGASCIRQQAIHIGCSFSISYKHLDLSAQDKRIPCVLSRLLTVGALLLFGSRVGSGSEAGFCWYCMFCTFLTALAMTKGFSLTWMMSYSSSLSIYRGKARIIPPSSPSLPKESQLRFVSHPSARGCQMLPEWLDGLRLVVFNEFWQRAVTSRVTTDQKLSWLTLVDHEMSTSIPASATRRKNVMMSLLVALKPEASLNYHKTDSPGCVLYYYSEKREKTPQQILTYKTEYKRRLYHWDGSGSSPAPSRGVFLQHSFRNVTNTIKFV